METPQTSKKIFKTKSTQVFIHQETNVFQIHACNNSDIQIHSDICNSSTEGLKTYRGVDMVHTTGDAVFHEFCACELVVELGGVDPLVETHGLAPVGGRTVDAEDVVVAKQDPVTVLQNSLVPYLLSVHTCPVHTQASCNESPLSQTGLSQRQKLQCNKIWFKLDFVHH